MTFLAAQKKMQTAWKLQTKTLPRLAKAPGLYCSRMFPFCLPLEFAAHNLFHEIRDDALATFDRLGIVWHGAALPGLPSNHLCSSQIACVNALYPFIRRPYALAALLLPHFPDISRMLPVEDESFIAFEWIGDTNYLGETPKLGAYRHRGAGNTSIDAMVMYEATDGRHVMLLIEWKYSESYGATYKRFRSDGTDRVEPYRAFFFDEHTPIDLAVTSRIEEFMFEPFYQLLRQQLFASRIAEVGIPDVDRVRLVHVHASGNRELKAITSPGFRDLGRDAYEVWQHILVEPSDFIAITTEDFLSHVPFDRFPELEPWRLYMTSRYTFLK